MENKQKTTSFRTSEELWRQFKMVCTAEDIKVSDKINEIVAAFNALEPGPDTKEKKGGITLHNLGCAYVSITLHQYLK